MTYISWSTDFGQIIKVKIFVQGRILNSTNGSKLVFHKRMYIYGRYAFCFSFYAPVASACWGHRAFGLSIDQVKIFVQGRISRPINGSKLIFHISMYLYETSRNIQEP